MEQRKNTESLHPILVWIIASILFHMLLLLGIITLKMNHIELPQPERINQQDRAILMMDEPKQKIMPTPQQVQQPIKKESEPKPQPQAQQPKEQPLNYRITPGKKGLDAQQIKKMTDLENLPKPQDQITDEQKSQNQAEQQAKQEEPIEKLPQAPEIIEKKEELPQETQLQELEEPDEKATQTRHSSSTTKMIDQEMRQSISKKPMEQETPSRSISQKQNPQDFVPKKQTSSISFKDLNLGFNEQIQTVGNSSSLIMNGTNFQVPTGTNLKHITYLNQCADMMVQAVRTHHSRRLVPATGHNHMYFKLSVDKSGRQLEFVKIKGTGNDLLDRIIEESIQSITLFPKVPSFINEEPFTMRWHYQH